MPPEKNFDITTLLKLFETSENKLCISHWNHSIRESHYRTTEAFSRYKFCIPLKTKWGEEVAKDQETILDQHWYNKIEIDSGGEFVDPYVKKVLQKYNTTAYCSLAPIKAAVAKWLIGSFLVSRYCALTNADDYILDFDKLLKFTINILITHFPSLVLLRIIKEMTIQLTFFSNNIPMKME